MSPRQMMPLFITFPENHLHAVLRGEYGPLPHPLGLPLMGFLSLAASRIDISLLSGMQTQVYE